MKFVSFWALSTFFILSCGKSVHSSLPSIQCKIDGKPVRIVGDIDSSHQDQITSVLYGCYAMTGKNSHTFQISGTDSAYSMCFDIHLPNDTLLTGTYRYDPYNPGAVWGTFDINGDWYVLNNAIKPITINILRYSNGTIDATFSGQFGYSTASMKTITEGRMSNIKVYSWR